MFESSRVVRKWNSWGFFFVFLRRWVRCPFSGSSESVRGSRDSLGVRGHRLRKMVYFRGARLRRLLFAGAGNRKWVMEKKKKKKRGEGGQ